MINQLLMENVCSTLACLRRARAFSAGELAGVHQPWPLLVTSPGHLLAGATELFFALYAGALRTLGSAMKASHGGVRQAGDGKKMGAKSNNARLADAPKGGGFGALFGTQSASASTSVDSSDAVAPPRRRCASR